MSRWRVGTHLPQVKGDEEDAEDDSLAVAVVVTVAAVLAAMVGMGIGQPTISHGGPPADAYMFTQAEKCIRSNAEGDIDQGEHGRCA